MAGVAAMIPSNNLADARKIRLLTLGDLDGRTNAAKAARALIAELEGDLGGADRLSAAEHAVVVRAAVTGAMVEHLEATWLSGGDYDALTYSTMVKLQLRLLTVLGLQRRTADDDLLPVVSITRTIVDPALPPTPPTNLE
jgi:hypothetical protein